MPQMNIEQSPASVYISPYELPKIYTEKVNVGNAINTTIQLEQKFILRDKMRARLLAKTGLLKINK